MAKLPLKKKAKKSSEEEEDIGETTDVADRSDATAVDDFSEKTKIDSPGTKSLIDQLKNKVASLNNKKNKKSDNSGDPDDGEATVDDTEVAKKKKKKKSKLIQIIIGVALVLFLLSDYIIPTEEPAPVVTSFKKPNRKKIKKPDSPSIVESPSTTETVKSETPPVPQETVETPTTETAPDSAVTVTSEDVPTPEKVEEPVVTEAPAVVETAPDPVVEETPQVVESENPPASVDSVDGSETITTTGDENLTDKILQDLEKQAKTTKAPEQKKEYVAPPDYEYKGRGLVYNCTGKHWACIDAPSYKTCEDNFSSVQYLKKKTECYSFNVYETSKGCDLMQNRMVSSSAKTNFCND